MLKKAICCTLLHIVSQFLTIISYLYKFEIKNIKHINIYINIV